MVTKERIQNAIESKWRLRQSITYLIVTVGAIGVCVLRVILDHSFQYGSIGETLLLICVIMAAVMVPFIVYPLWKYYWIIREWDAYEAYEVVLDRPNTSWLYKGAIYYTVRFQDRYGNLIAMDTKPIFSGGAFAWFPLDTYNNRTVTVYYDAKRERLLLGYLKA